MIEIQLANGNGCAIVDDRYEWLNIFSWYLSKSGRHNAYARTEKWVNGKRIRIYMHRLIMWAKKGQEIDHISGDMLDNRRENLRFCTRGQNLSNQKKCSGTSKYKGVCWDKDNRKWRAGIQLNGKSTKLGRFNEEIEAARAYDTEAKKLFGEFARLNFP